MSVKKNAVKKVTPDPAVLEAKEIERLRRDIYRSDMEKLKLFTQMLRVNSLFKKATVTHK